MYKSLKNILKKKLFEVRLSFYDNKVIMAEKKKAKKKAQVNFFLFCFLPHCGTFSCTDMLWGVYFWDWQKYVAWQWAGRAASRMSYGGRREGEEPAVVSRGRHSLGATQEERHFALLATSYKGHWLPPIAPTPANGTGWSASRVSVWTWVSGWRWRLGTGPVCVYLQVTCGVIGVSERKQGSGYRVIYCQVLCGQLIHGRILVMKNLWVCGAA